uniref:Putative basic tail protein n=1 Tax=Amblyomma triste TaxID=251400 RepID=A0A023G9X9_AMBTT
MAVFLFLSILVFQEVNAQREYERGCPHKDPDPLGSVVQSCNYYCLDNETMQYKEGYYVNGTRCTITHIPGVQEGVCIDLLGKEGCHVPTERFARLFFKLINSTITTRRPPKTNPVTAVITTTTQWTTTRSKRKNSKKTRKPKKPKIPKKRVTISKPTSAVTPQLDLMW